MSDQDERVRTQHERQRLVELLRETGELPESYGRTGVTLAPVEPYLVHVFWEVAPEDLERGRSRFDPENGCLQSILRFYDITYINFDGTNAHGHFDIEIDLRVGNWYVHLWSPEKTYVVDLGLRADDGKFRQLARSNVAHVPSAWPHPATGDRGEQPPTEIRSAPEQQETAFSNIDENGSKKLIDTEPARLTPSGESSNSREENRKISTQEEGPELTAIPRLLDAAPLLKREYSELYAHLMKDRPLLKPEEQAAMEKLRKGFDLTEISESHFGVGISSLILSHWQGGSGGAR